MYTLGSNGGDPLKLQCEHLGFLQPGLQAESDGLDLSVLLPPKSCSDSKCQSSPEGELCSLLECL